MKPTVHIMSTATPSHHWFSGTESTVNNTQCTMQNPIYSAVWPLTQVNNTQCTHVQCSLNTHSNQCELCTVWCALCSVTAASTVPKVRPDLDLECNLKCNTCAIFGLGMQCKLQGFWLLINIGQFGQNPMRIGLWLKSNGEKSSLKSDLEKNHLWTSKQLTQLILMVMVVMNMDRILMTFLTMMAMLTSPAKGKL